ncbi:MAG: tetratricopeptide repeat protein [Myxococcota bacterium]
MKFWPFFLAFVPVCGPSAAAAPESDTVRDLQELIASGRLDDASAALEGYPEPMRLRFEGLIALERGDVDQAVRAFEGAAEHAQDPSLRLHLAHAYLLNGQPKAALETVQTASSAQASMVAQPLIEARARHAMGDRSGAYAVLRRASIVFQDEIRPLLELVAIAREAGLATEARSFARGLLTRSERSGLAPDAARALFHLLSEDEDALPILESISARFPDDGDLRARLARVYAGLEQWYAAARLFDDATRLGADHAFEAADQYRMAGRYEAARRANARIRNEPRGRIQQLTILFEGGEYARVAALPNPPRDAASRYRVAYAHYALGQRGRAAALARALVRTGASGPYVQSAHALLKAMGLATDDKAVPEAESEPR